MVGFLKYRKARDMIRLLCKHELRCNGYKIKVQLVRDQDELTNSPSVSRGQEVQIKNSEQQLEFLEELVGNFRLLEEEASSPLKNQRMFEIIEIRHELESSSNLVFRKPLCQFNTFS